MFMSNSLSVPTSNKFQLKLMDLDKDSNYNSNSTPVKSNLSRKYTLKKKFDSAQKKYEQ